MIKELLNTRADANTKHAMLLLLRVGIGAMMLTHGVPKLMKVLSGDFAFGNPIGLGSELSLFMAVFAEVFCSVLLILGLGTRFAVIPLIITMLVAVFIVHAGDPFGSMEKAVLYLLVYISLLAGGSGKYSLDEKLFTHRDN